MTGIHPSSGVVKENTMDKNYQKIKPIDYSKQPSISSITSTVTELGTGIGVIMLITTSLKYYEI